MSLDLKSINDELNNNIDLVNNAKSILVKNLNNKGVSAAVTEEMITLANKVENIKRGQGNAKEGDVLAGRTFTGDDGIVRTGNIPDRRFSANSNNYTTAKRAKGDWGGNLCIVPQTGYYVEEANSSDFGPIIIYDPVFKPENIVSGKNIFGVVGNANIQKASHGNFVAQGGWQNVRGLTFKARFLILTDTNRIDQVYAIYNADITNQYLYFDRGMAPETSFHLQQAEDIKTYNNGFDIYYHIDYDNPKNMTWYAFG